MSLLSNNLITIFYLWICENISLCTIASPLLLYYLVIPLVIWILVTAFFYFWACCLKSSIDVCSTKLLDAWWCLILPRFVPAALIFLHFATKLCDFLVTWSKICSFRSLMSEKLFHNFKFIEYILIPSFATIVPCYISKISECIATSNLFIRYYFYYFSISFAELRSVILFTF